MALLLCDSHMPREWHALPRGYTIPFQFFPDHSSPELYIHIRTPGFDPSLDWRNPARGEQWSFSLSLSHGNAGQLPTFTPSESDACDGGPRNGGDWVRSGGLSDVDTLANLVPHTVQKMPAKSCEFYICTWDSAVHYGIQSTSNLWLAAKP
jgi:hypothetical protein